ncbi:BQ2448_923 [Microbotryum intermedium]|uniref:non-specific serine/threonine protein kinase n=1 Tax=Microbotryum intermedium TaxID=269621 RepID=A0A238F443_9BASI|nr:BQ2448_923 [Microbotryum intermedium]
MMAGPSVTQGMPSATLNMLHELNPAYSRVFPTLTTGNLAHGGVSSHASSKSLVVRPDTNHVDTPESLNELATKSAMLRVILNGWIEGLMAEQSKSGAHESNGPSKMIRGLSNSLPGPLLFIRSKPRVLVFRVRKQSTTAVAAPASILAGLSDLRGPTQASLNAALTTSDDGLAAYLLPRTIKAAACLQAALLVNPLPREMQADDESTTLWRERSQLLKDLEEVMVTIVHVLAESGVRIEYGNPREGTTRGGVGRAREIMTDLINMNKALFSRPSTDPYPWRLTMSKSYVDTFDDDQSSIEVRSPIHARALSMLLLRMLVKMASVSPFLGDFTPQVVELVVQSWPRRAVLRRQQSAATSSMADKGKHRAYDHDLNVIAASLELIVEVLHRPLAACSDQAIGALVLCAMDELHSRIGTEASMINAENDDATASSLIADSLAAISASLYTTLAHAEYAVHRGGSQLRQILSHVIVDNAEYLVECLKSSVHPFGIRIACLFSLAFALAPSPSTLSTPAVDHPLTSAVEYLPPSVAFVLAEYVSHHPTMPLDLNGSLLNLRGPATVAWKRLSHDLNPSTSDVLFTSEVATSNGKRPRQGDTMMVPSSDGMDIDGMSGSTARRGHKVLWKEPVAQILRTGLGAEDRALESAGPDRVIQSLANSLDAGNVAKSIGDLRTIGLLACARDGALVFSPSSEHTTSVLEPSCRFCDAWSGGSSKTDESEQDLSLSISGGRSFNDGPLTCLRKALRVVGPSTVDAKLKLAFLRALLRILRHSRIAAGVWDLTFVETDAGSTHRDMLLGFVVEQLEAPTRPLRLAAGRVLGALCHAHQVQDRDAAFVEELFENVLMRRLNHSSASVLETTLLTLGRIARLAIPQAKLECEALAGLVARLGHPNIFIKSVAKTQLEAVAAYRDIKTYALVQPHFATIAPLLVGPGSATTLAAAMDCFHQPREALLRLTREHTLPKVVLDENASAIEDIAKASSLTVPVMLTQGAPAAAVLAKLYMLEDERRQKRGLIFYMNQIKSNVQAQAFGNGAVTLPAILGSLKVPLVYRLALELGDEDPRVSTQAERALKNVERASEALTSKTNIELGEVLKASIVGILSHMNRALNEPTTHRPLCDKQQIIRSLAAVTGRVGPAIAGFSPQIMATLQSALEVEGLREVTLRGFKSFISSLKFSEIGPFIGPCTATLVRLWHDFTPIERAAATETIEYIVLFNSDDLKSFVQDVVDLGGIPDLAQCQQRLLHIRRAWSFGRKTEHLLARISSENDVVSLQALKELKELMSTLDVELQQLLAGDIFDRSIGSLVKVLFGAAVKDGPDQDRIRNMVFECLGILGALDPDRFELPPGDAPTIVLENFTNKEESVEFALHLIQDLLIGAYRSTNDTKHQEFLAYAIQELLTYCGFTPDLVLSSTSGTSKSKATVDQSVRERWNRLPKSVLETCGPLLGGRFSFKERSISHAVQYPIYSTTSSYRDWIRIFANDLILKLEGEAKRVFGPFPPVLHLEDIAVAQHLLPHLVLHTLISGTDDDRLRIGTEIREVLADQTACSRAVSENSRRLSAQTVFDLMDHVSRWITLARKHLLELKSRRRGVAASTKHKSSSIENAFQVALLNVESTLQGIPRIVVGHAALTCKAYARALLAYESHIVAYNSQKDSPEDHHLQDDYEHLHECYAALDEPDGMEGISTKITSAGVQHQIREHESTGRWTSAQSCWEIMLQEEPMNSHNHVGLMRCLQNLGHYGECDASEVCSLGMSIPVSSTEPVFVIRRADSMRTHIAGILHSSSDPAVWDRILAPFNIEASLFVGDWDSVEQTLGLPDLTGPEAAFGRVVCAMRDAMSAENKADDGENPTSSLEQAFLEARMQLGSPIVAAGRESYRRVYDAVVHLHILNELQAIHLAPRTSAMELPPELIARLNFRYGVTSPSFRAREPILNMRRTAFRLRPPGIDNLPKPRIKEIGRLWLETSKIARKAGHTQTAYSAILQARELQAPYTFLQSAKLLMASDQSYRAIQEIDNGLRAAMGPPSEGPGQPHASPLAPVTGESPGPLAKAVLRRARWMHEAGRLESDEILTLYRDAEKLAPEWESPPYYLGRYLDQFCETSLLVLGNSRKKPNLVTELCHTLDYRVRVVEMFIQALCRGTKFIYQAMPRMLTIWLEIGDAKPVIDVVNQRREDPRVELRGNLFDLHNAFISLDKLINKAITKLPAYQWLTVLPQLVSRILHPNKKVVETLEKILSHVLRSYPHHGFWAMASGAKSTTQQRSRRNMRVLEKAKSVASANSNVSSLIDVGLKLVDELLGLCNYSLEKNNPHPRLHKDFPQLHRLAPTDLIIPLQSSLNVTLPSQSQSRKTMTHQPFPERLPSFKDFDDAITIMSSLQKPRKITVIGSDGMHYSFLCKPKDDLRKDARLMEFNSMIIKLLKKDSDARGRRLGIRTYAVVPLNEDCGLIEWVPHVVVLRGVLNKAYQAKGIAPWSPELKKTFDTIRSNPKEIANRFVNEVQKKSVSRFQSTTGLVVWAESFICALYLCIHSFPPVFHEWFLETFPEPSAWLRARLAYSRTAAVISMVGFVLGLGDRHCENILLDGTTGDTVHVDFNCLFDRGRTFDVPEQVPFRLTANIVDGMGVTGVEGVYRRAAEITLRILRDNKDSLMSVLETFLHDPLVEWQPSKSRSDNKSTGKDDQGSIIRKAKTSLDPISNKLRGLQVTSDPASLGSKEVTIGEQVERLIREARNPKNLGSMYVGW